MTERTNVHRLQVATSLHRFIEDEVLPGTGVDSGAFWKGFDAIVGDLAPRNIALLAERDRLQTELDTWHKAHPGPIADMAGYRKFLETIGYIVPEPGNVQATTTNVDDELAVQAGPQLVVPILNARYALNAANARWGSLYDALYGTDAISEDDGCAKGPGFNEKRGAKVVAFARHFLECFSSVLAQARENQLASGEEGPGAAPKYSIVPFLGIQGCQLPYGLELYQRRQDAGASSESLDSMDSGGGGMGVAGASARGPPPPHKVSALGQSRSSEDVSLGHPKARFKKGFSLRNMSLCVVDGVKEMWQRRASPEQDPPGGQRRNGGLGVGEAPGDRWAQKLRLPRGAQGHRAELLEVQREGALRYVTCCRARLAMLTL